MDRSSRNNSKIYGTKEPTLFYPDDSPEFYVLITNLIQRKYYVKRTSKHQVKHRAVNYYPSTGTITIDGIGRHPGKGEEALLALLEQMYPMRRGAPVAPASSAPPRPAPLILEIDLDHEDGPVGRDHDRKQDDDAGLPW